MDSFKLAQLGAIALLSVLSACCLLGLFQVQISEILGTFFALLLRPFLQINDVLQSFWRGVASFYRNQFVVNGQLDLQQVFFQFIGAVLYSIFFFGFNFSEFHLLALSMTAAGIDAGHFSSPIGAGTLTAFALIASFLFWGAVILDLCGVTHTAPWRETLSEKWKKSLFYVAIFSLALSLFATASMGFFRGKVIADESLTSESYIPGLGGGISGSTTNFSQNTPSFYPQGLNDSSAGLYYWIPIMANVCIPILVGIGGVFASWGVVTLIKFVLLTAIFLIISPLGLFLIASSLLVNIVDRLYQFANALFQLLAEIGSRFMSIFGWTAPDSKNIKDPDGGTSAGNSGDRSDSQETELEQGLEDSLEKGWDPFNK
jgi:hypothetical protein